MKDALIHILDQSACLSKRQLKDYVQGVMSEEETYAVEVHLNACPLCSTAMDGMLINPTAALEAVAELNPSFIREHFDRISPQIHLNSVAPAVTASHEKKKTVSISMHTWRMLAAAALILIAFGLLWRFEFSNDSAVSKPLAQNEKNTVDPGPAAPPPANQALKQNISDQPATGSNGIIGSANKQTNADPVSTITEQQQKPTSSGYTSNSDAETNQMLERSDGDKVTAPVMTAPAPSAQAARDESVMTVSKNVAGGSSSATAGSVANGTTTNRSTAKKDQPTDYLEQGNTQFDQQKYTGAIASYKKELSGSDQDRRQQAMLMTAKSYINLGQNDKAIPLLEAIVKEGGSQKHAARKLLRQIR